MHAVDGWVVHVSTWWTTVGLWSWVRILQLCWVCCFLRHVVSAYWEAAAAAANDDFSA